MKKRTPSSTSTRFSATSNENYHHFLPFIIIGEKVSEVTYELWWLQLVYHFEKLCCVADGQP